VCRDGSQVEPVCSVERARGVFEVAVEFVALLVGTRAVGVFCGEWVKCVCVRIVHKGE
jgi:hypothetical protein